MNEISKKLGYLNGLIKAGTAGETPVDPLFPVIADLLNDLTAKVLSHEILIKDLNDYVESIDDDLTELEEHGPDRDDLYEDDYPSFNETDALRVINGGAGRASQEPVRSYTGCVCPLCAAMFVTDTQDAPDSKYRCPSCDRIVTPEPLSAENIRPVKPVRE